MNIPTPHISAEEKNAFAETVLMPGDPLRSKFVAENYLENAVLVNNTRGVQGYTGYYKGQRVSVMASGMGMPSIGIYSYELFNFYDVKNIIRIGSAGAISDEVNIRDIVIGMSASTDSAFVNQFALSGNYAPTASFGLLSKAVESAKSLGINVKVGNIFSTDSFYDDSNSLEQWKKMNVLAVEMEAAALYMNAARSGKNALAVCTISDAPLRNEPALSAQEREKSLDEMIRLALECAL